jgi:hypothetical protein
MAPMERHIQIPNPISFVDPSTGEPSGQGLTFRDFILKLMDNPKWVQSYRTIKSADAINKALDLAVFSSGYGGEPMVIDEEDWKLLAEAVENPKQLHISREGSTTVIPGFGLHPRVATQILPFCDAILLAPQKEKHTKVKVA